VGPSGSGKSTLLRLLAGIYPPTVGRVALSPRDEAPTPDRIALAPDAPAILRASLYENLVLGRDDLTPALVEAWLRAHGLAPFFTRFEQGLATIVGEGARPLSRGERQVLSIVRVLLTAPGAVVADEVIDPLDPELTALVLQLLDTAARTRVVVLSTQRQDLAATDRQVWRLEAGVLRHVDAADRHAARQIPTSRSA
jgi:ABC-type transport system involved in cytochrome bd biosynthesis fused ATPase/permease subunit